MTVADGLSLADAILTGQVNVPGRHAPRAAAVLARQALEEIVDQQLDLSSTQLGRASMRSRLIILRDQLGEDAGNKALAAWDGLSRCCHHHSYELQPSSAEVTALIQLVRAVPNTSVGP